MSSARSPSVAPRRPAARHHSVAIGCLCQVVVVIAAPESDLERWCEGKVVLSYVGNMGISHDWDTLADAVSTLIGDPGVKTPFGVVVAGDLLTSLARRASAATALGQLSDLHAAEIVAFGAALAGAVVYRTGAVVPGLGARLLEPIAAGACLVVLSQTHQAWTPKIWILEGAPFRGHLSSSLRRRLHAFGPRQGGTVLGEFWVHRLP